MKEYLYPKPPNSVRIFPEFVKIPIKLILGSGPTRFAVSQVAYGVVRGTHALAVCLVLGRLVSLRLQHDRVTSAPRTTPEKPGLSEQPEPGKTPPGWTSNALVAGLIIGLVTAILSGVVSYLVAERTTREQDQDTARQAVSSHQTQELMQMQKSADTIGQDAQNVAIYAIRCSFKGKKWATCIFDAPDYFKLIADSGGLGTIADSTTDHQADSIALQLSDKVTALISSSTSLAGIKDLGAITNTQLALDQRCGLLIQGFS